MHVHALPPTFGVVRAHVGRMLICHSRVDLLNRELFMPPHEGTNTRARSWRPHSLSPRFLAPKLA
jgi:hypothetical protein